MAQTLVSRSQETGVQFLVRSKNDFNIAFTVHTGKQASGYIHLNNHDIESTTKHFNRHEIYLGPSYKVVDDTKFQNRFKITIDSLYF